MTTLRHDTPPEQAEAAVYAALAGGQPSAVVKVHGFPEDSLNVILGRLPAGWTVAQRSPSRVVLANSNAVTVGSSATAWERFASFNVLGSHHTDPGGKNAGLGAGPWRMRQTIREWNRLGVTFGTVQEYETPQKRALLDRARWATFTGTPNNKFRNGDVMGNGIVWRKDVWELVDSYSLPVPITGRRLYMPVVILRHRRTGYTTAVMSVHNPSTGPISGGSQADRENAKRIEREYAGRLSAMGLPVVIGGDFNERDAAQAFPGLDVAVSRGVDFVLTAGTGERRPKVIEDGVRGRLSDHPMVTALLGLFGGGKQPAGSPRLPRGV